MNSRSARWHAAIVLPLLGATLVSTYLPPAVAPPLMLALAPLGWAAFIIIAAGIDDALDAYAWALPFSAYAAAAFADAPHLVAPALAFAVTGAVASVAVAALAGDFRTGAARWRRSTLLAAMLAGWFPGCAAAFAAGPWSGVAVAMLTTLVALYFRARSSR